MLKVIIVFLCCMFIVACDDKPGFAEVENNFYTNKEAFDQLAKIACKVGHEKNPINRFNYRLERLKPEQRIKALDALLAKIGSSGFAYRKTPLGKCSLAVGYYTRGFAGSGISYSYSFQLETPQPFEPENHVFEKITAVAKDMRFDMPLINGWYFTFTYS